jgi:prevent-host-death family protein
MKRWPVQDAKARFSELLKASITEGPQMVTLRGLETAVLVPAKEWRLLLQHSTPSFKTLLLTPEHRVDLPIPARGTRRRRASHPIG